MSKVSFGTDDAVGALKRLLDVNAARQKVAARNLANSATEDYQPKKVEFTKELNRAVGRVEVARTNPRHLSSRGHRNDREGFVEIVDDSAAEDEATRLETTVANLADAEMAYATTARLMSKRIATLRTAITGKP